jgi:hypothetical protein
MSNPVNGFLFTNQSTVTVTIIDDDLDSDNDGISNADEQNGYFGPATNPFAWDSDGDGISDLTEIVLGTNPNNSSSFPSLSTIPLPFVTETTSR